MVSLQPPLCDFGWKARDFDLPGVDGKRYDLAGAPRDLFNAMLQIAQTGQGPREQIASMGCSIKWKNAA